MIGLQEWLRSTRFPDRPWLVLGKGPSFARRDEFDLTAYNLLALNHVVAEQRVDVAHVIDIDVVEACGDALLTNADWVLMPRVPHVQQRPSLRRLEEFVEAIPVLRRLDEAGKLVWYNAETSGQVFPGSPVVEVRWFSAEAALNLLAIMGVRTVRSLGIDGGQSYASAFGTLSNQTRLANGLPSFDAQFTEIERIVRLHGLDYAPLVDPVRVFVGADESQLVAARVLEHSIREHTDALVRVVPMLDVPLPMPKHRRNRPRTAFSFARFAIPALCGYRGRAIYLDADMQVFADIRELWERPFGDNLVQVTRQDEAPAGWKDNSWFHPGPQMSVMVLDCGRLDWDVAEIVRGLDEGRYSYQDLMFELCVVPPERIDTTLPPEWNHLEHYEPGVTRLVHYTIVPTQPWKTADNPRRDLWLAGYRDAVQTGAVPAREVEHLVAKGHVASDLLEPLKTAPVPPRADRSSAALELEMARRRIDTLEGRQLRGRVRQVARRLTPLVRKARQGGPSSRLGAVVDRVADRARRILR